MSNRNHDFVAFTSFSYLSSNHHRKIIEKYVPKEMIPADWKCDHDLFSMNVKSLYNSSEELLRMYDSAHNFETEILTVAGFPGGHKFFEMKSLDVYLPMVLFYQNSSFMYRNDLMSMILHKIDLLPFTSQMKFGFIMVHGYLRTKENQLPLTSDLINVPSTLFQTFSDRISGFSKMFRDETWKQLIPKEGKFESSNFEDLLTVWHSLVCQDDDVNIEKSDIAEPLEKFVNQFPIGKYRKLHQKVFTWVHLIIKVYKKVFDRYILLMLQQSETRGIIKRDKIPVRVFDGNVIAHELLNILKNEGLDVTEFEERVADLPLLSVLPIAEIDNILPSTVFEQLEFVFIGLVNAELGSSLSPTYDGSYLVSIASVVCNLLENLITKKRVFQEMKADKKKVVEDFFDSLEDFMDRKTNFGVQQRFIDWKDEEEFKATLDTWYKDNFSHPSSKIVSRTRGFSMKRVKHQLEELKLNQVFPDILDRLDERMIREKPFVDMDRLDRVVYAHQVFSLFTEFPKFAKYLHKRKWCQRPSQYSCPECRSLKANLQLASVPTSEQIEGSIEVNVASSEKLVDPIFKTQLKSEKPEPRKQPSASRSKNEKIKGVAAMTSQKESTTCPKCSRASGFTKILNKKLQLRKVETKLLSKRNDELELSDLMKEERIQRLEELLRTARQEISTKDQIIARQEQQLKYVVEKVTSSEDFFKELAQDLL